MFCLVTKEPAAWLHQEPMQLNLLLQSIQTHQTITCSYSMDQQWALSRRPVRCKAIWSSTRPWCLQISLSQPGLSTLPPRSTTVQGMTNTTTSIGTRVLLKLREATMAPQSSEYEKESKQANNLNDLLINKPVTTLNPMLHKAKIPNWPNKIDHRQSTGQY